MDARASTFIAFMKQLSAFHFLSSAQPPNVRLNLLFSSMWHLTSSGDTNSYVTIISNEFN